MTATADHFGPGRSREELRLIEVASGLLMLSPQRPLPRDPHPPLGLLDPDHRLVAVAATLHDRPNSGEQAGQFDSPDDGHQAAARQAWR